MKVCFVGIGSIAKRHIRNLIDICNEKKIDLHLDALRSSSNNDLNGSINLHSVYYKLEELPNDYDIIFITNPTIYHADSIIQLKNKSKNFFIEKPIATYDTMDKLSSFIEKENSIYYVACPMRYNPVITYIKNNIDINSIYSIRAISSSYLPDWRPNVDYRKVYSARSELGGGVDIDLIHEWDYITDIFGYPKDIKMISGKISNLEINSNDFAIYIAKFDNKICELHLDYFGRKTIRAIELYCEDDTIICDIQNQKIKYLKSDKELKFNEERDDIQKKELINFLNLIDKKNDENINVTNDIKHSLKVLNLARAVIE